MRAILRFITQLIMNEKFAAGISTGVINGGTAVIHD